MRPPARLTPVEVLVGAGVLAAAWGLVGQIALPFALIGLAALSTVAGLRSGGRSLLPAFAVSLLPVLSPALLAGLASRLAHVCLLRVPRDWGNWAPTLAARAEATVTGSA